MAFPAPSPSNVLDMLLYMHFPELGLIESRGILFSYTTDLIR